MKPENLTRKVRDCYTWSSFEKDMHLQKVGVNANEKVKGVFLFDTDIKI